MRPYSLNSRILIASTVGALHMLLSLSLMNLPKAVAQIDGQALLARIQSLAIPLEAEQIPDALIDAAAERPFVLLGEASHGTSEFYTLRAEISKRLIEEHDYAFIAVEGDWDASQAVNAYIKDLPGAAPSAEEALMHFERWPPWMWNNREVLELVTWLREYNADKPREDQVGFYGIDVYGMGGSLEAVLAYFEEIDSDFADDVAAAYDCLMPHRENGGDYARALALGGDSCEAAVRRVVDYLRGAADAYRERDAKAYFNAKQHALVVQNAEAHYRTALQGGAASWNARAEHFALTAERLLEFHEDAPGGIVWAHNTHIGDARATAMADSGRSNIGQVLRERAGREAVYAVGFGTHRGQVLAGSAWGQAMQTMTAPEAAPGTWEDALHHAGIPDSVLLFTPEDRTGILGTPIGHRAIGVVYNPQQEYPGNYVPSRLADRYDAFVYVESSSPLDSLAE